jgi:hypothetical protein
MDIKNAAIIRLFADVNAEHQAACRAADDALQHAMRAGDAKAAVPHGHWQGWLAEHFSSARTARAYMRLSSQREAIEAKRQRSAILPIEQALRARSGLLNRRGQHDDVGQAHEGPST